MNDKYKQKNAASVFKKDEWVGVTTGNLQSQQISQENEADAIIWRSSGIFVSPVIENQHADVRADDVKLKNLIFLLFRNFPFTRRCFFILKNGNVACER